jgi:hypothetical protein
VERYIERESPQFWSGMHLRAPMASACIVRAEATTHLDLPQEDSVELAGELTLLGAKPVGWTALLLPQDSPLGSWNDAQAQDLYFEERLELRLARPGTYRLELRSASLLVFETLQLDEGRTEWHRRWDAGRLRVAIRAAAKSAGYAHSLLRYVAEDAGSTHCVSTYVDSFWSEDFVLDVPAGNGRLETLTDGAPESDWRLVRELSVPAGREVAVDYP